MWILKTLRKNHKATQHNTRPEPTFYKEKATVGWDLNPCLIHCKCDVLPTERLRKISWVISNHPIQSKPRQASQPPDKQEIKEKKRPVYLYIHVYTCTCNSFSLPPSVGREPGEVGGRTRSSPFPVFVLEVVGMRFNWVGRGTAERVYLWLANSTWSGIDRIKDRKMKWYTVKLL